MKKEAINAIDNFIDDKIDGDSTTIKLNNKALYEKQEAIRRLNPVILMEDGRQLLREQY